MAEIQLSVGEPFNIEVRQGETYSGLRVEEYQDEAGTVPLSNVGYAAKLQVRKSKDDAEVIVGTNRRGRHHPRRGGGHDRHRHRLHEDRRPARRVRVRPAVEEHGDAAGCAVPVGGEHRR